MAVQVKPDIKLLLVDDREDNLFAIEAILEPDGYNLYKARSGRAALRILLKEVDFTLILMDVQMPELNGFETATLIYQREVLRHIPIIFITANDYPDETMFTGYRMGGVDYIKKPINPDLLRTKVSVFVDLYRKNHLLRQQEQHLIQLNQQLTENIHQLRVTNEELERFAYAASHDLQEPLRKIMLFSERLVSRTRELDTEGKGYIDKITRAASRMQVLIKNILEFSRSAADSNVFEETDLTNLVEGLVSDLEVSIEQKNATVTVAPLPILKVIPTQIRQLFQNLLINALKFSRDDPPPFIRVFARIDGDVCEVCVQDNGIGFEQKYADKIFSLFSRLHSYDQFEGTGIGLAICKKIAEKHGGRIDAYSEPGKGATFVVGLPTLHREIPVESVS
ncbi:sensor histidine kinase [Dinghuibacter silviterrae]|uniref:histidine kinase n=1 Tax=Dinghuibacter silviterrae TaxID=1539049 RepID=A0A4R8DJV6_9BACT|nr:ATP-binding protein [Dinghuibacter silviterrae]TDW97604.1 phospho-acceptor domain-containing protein [Dinghuibacter silviterrae]